MRIDSATGINSALTGSFSGSFKGTGDFTGLTADSVAYANVTGKPTLVSGSAQIDAQSATNPSAVFDNSGTPELRTGITAAEVRTAIGVDASGTDNSTDVTIAAGRDYVTISGQELTLGEVDISDDTNLAVASAGSTQGDVNLTLTGDELSAASVGLGTGDSPTFTDLTLSGNLTVSGTTTTVDSNTLNIGDNIVALNGVGSNLGGIAVNDGPASGSLLWDGTNNYWIAGATGSEAQVLTTGNVDSDILTFSLPASTTISAFGATLVDDADAAAARTTLGVDVAGTDNSTDVTLTGTPDYLTLSGQEITLGTIDISDDTNLAAGTGVTLTGDTLSIGQAVGTSDDVTFNTVITSKVGSSTNDEYFDFGTDAQVDLKIDDVVDFRFLDGGTFHANSDIIAYSTTIASDERLKENITDTEHGLDTVLSLEAKEFDWIEKNGGKHDIGFIAQQVQEVLPVLVKEVEGLNGEDAHLTVNYTQLIPVLVNAIKELNAKVEACMANKA